MASDKKRPDDKEIAARQRAMLDRLRELSARTPATAERRSDSDLWGPTRVEPLPPAEQLLPDDHRPTVQHIPRALGRRPIGARDETPDSAPTSQIHRVPAEPTPAPLPPQPELEQAAQSWFEQVPTSPASPVGPFGALDSAVTGATPVRDGTGAVVAGDTRPATRSRLRPPGGWADRAPWTLPALLAATSLAVGMVLGALLFGGAAAPAAADAGACRPCPDPAAAADAGPTPPARGRR
ncbi:MAG: hypothetical protein D6689_00370 [Deltaproteobacteria bacterium]|nr:MAG: hypothetical protein D6689_00370 [Deltaproteobacteria bacterium]